MTKSREAFVAVVEVDRGKKSTLDADLAAMAYLMGCRGDENETVPTSRKINGCEVVTKQCSKVIEGEEPLFIAVINDHHTDTRVRPFWSCQSAINWIMGEIGPDVIDEPPSQGEWSCRWSTEGDHAFVVKAGVAP